LSGLALNGWQRITRVSGNSLMNWGTQIQFKPSPKILLNYSTFIGTDKPDSNRLLRIFHNLYGVFNITDKLGLTAGFDIGAEEKKPTGGGTNTWYAPIVILKYNFNDKWKVAAKLEYYKDKNGVIISTGSPHGFQTAGYSLNIDHHLVKNVLIRLEARNFSSKDKIFTKSRGLTNTSTFITSSVAVSF